MKINMPTLGLFLYICFMKTYTVYALVNPITEHPFYVGETSHLGNRIRRHLNNTEKVNKDKFNYINQLLLYGQKPKIVILDYNISTKEEAVKMESYYIEKYKLNNYSLVNKNNGGNKPPSQKGKKQTEQTKKLRSINSPLIKKVQQIDKLGNVVNEFYGVREACRETKIDHRSIAQVAGGSKIRKTAGGYKWKYI